MNNVDIEFNTNGQVISKYIYGHFAEHLGRCIYDGIFVGENPDIPNTKGIRNDIIEALKNIKIPVLRWPGGCFADEYHWMDGIGPKENRKKSINTHWGMVTESHEFGTHEFFNLCELLNCEAYVAGNIGSGTVKEMQDWVDYISCKSGSSMSQLRNNNGRKSPWSLPFFGVGNENWACGGNMTAQYYSDLYKQYQTYVRSFSKDKIKKIACGPNSGDYNWTDTVMKNAGKLMWGLSLHYYTTVNSSFSNMGYATNFNINEWYNIINNSYIMDEYITKHSEIMDKYDPSKKVALVIDEWGTWYNSKPGTNRRFLNQQNTIRDAISASIHFNIFHKHTSRVKMANLAQTVNVLQSVLLTDDDVLIKTPTYHVFDLYKCHQENMLLDINEKYEKTNILSSTASYNKENNMISFSISNADASKVNHCNISISNISNIKNVSAKILIGDKIDSHNTKEDLENVKIVDYIDYTINKKEIILKLPPRSVLTMNISI